MIIIIISPKTIGSVNYHEYYCQYTNFHLSVLYLPSTCKEFIQRLGHDEPLQFANSNILHFSILSFQILLLEWRTVHWASYSLYCLLRYTCLYNMGHQCPTLEGETGVIYRLFSIFLPRQYVMQFPRNFGSCCSTACSYITRLNKLWFSYCNDSSTFGL